MRDTKTKRVGLRTARCGPAIMTCRRRIDRWLRMLSSARWHKMPQPAESLVSLAVVSKNTREQGSLSLPVGRRKYLLLHCSDSSSAAHLTPNLALKCCACGPVKEYEAFYTPPVIPNTPHLEPGHTLSESRTTCPPPPSKNSLRHAIQPRRWISEAPVHGRARGMPAPSHVPPLPLGRRRWPCCSCVALPAATHQIQCRH